MRLQILLLLLVLAWPFASAAEIPPVLYTAEPHQMYPVWVSADAAIAVNGRVDPALFRESDRNFLEEHVLDTPPGARGCVEFEEFYVEMVGEPDRSTLGRSARAAKVILFGTITDQDFGVHRSTPGQLFEVQPDKFLAGKMPEQSYYFFLPVGRFSFGDAEICKTDSRYPEPPAVGHEVLLMIPRLTAHVGNTRGPSEQFFYLDGPESLIVLKDDGQLGMPQRGAAAFTDARSRAELEQEIRRALGKGHRHALCSSYGSRSASTLAANHRICQLLCEPSVGPTKAGGQQYLCGYQPAHPRMSCSTHRTGTGRWRGGRRHATATPSRRGGASRAAARGGPRLSSSALTARRRRRPQGAGTAGEPGRHVVS